MARYSRRDQGAPAIGVAYVGGTRRTVTHLLDVLVPSEDCSPTRRQVETCTNEAPRRHARRLVNYPVRGPSREVDRRPNVAATHCRIWPLRRHGRRAHHLSVRTMARAPASFRSARTPCALSRRSSAGPRPDCPRSCAWGKGLRAFRVSNTPSCSSCASRLPCIRQLRDQGQFAPLVSSSIAPGPRNSSMTALHPP